MSANTARRSRSRPSLREDRGVNVLLSGSTLPDPADHLDVAVGSDADPGGVLVVSTRLSPEEVVATLRDRGCDPDRLAVVSTRGDSLDDAGAGSVETTVLDSPADLTGVGIAVTEVLREWAEADLDGPVLVSMDSLNDFLGYAETERVLQFVHRLAYLLRRNGATGYYWFDSSAFDPKTVAMVEELFDAVEDAG